MYGLRLPIPREVLLTDRNKWAWKLVQAERLLQILFQEQRFFWLWRCKVTLDNRMFVENLLQLILRRAHFWYKIKFICKLQVHIKLNLTRVHLVLLPAQGHKDRFYRSLKVNQSLVAPKQLRRLLESSLPVLIFNIEYSSRSQAPAQGWFLNFFFVVRLWWGYRLVNDFVQREGNSIVIEFIGSGEGGVFD